MGTSAAVGFSTWAFPRDDVDRSIDYALAHEFAALEVALLEPALFGTEDLLPTDDQARRVARRCAGMRLSVHAPIDQITLADLDPAIRAASVTAMHRAIHAAHLLGAEVVVCHLIRLRKDPDLPLAADVTGRAYAAEHLRELGAAAAEAGVVLAVENVGFSARAADRDYGGLCALIDEIALDNVGIALDVGHAHVHRARCGGVAASADLFGERVRHYHVHDNAGVTDDHVRVGAGDIDFSALSTRWAGGFAGILAMEIFPFVEADLDEAVLASRGALTDLLDLRT